jgi:hypothetical protein
MRSRTLRPLTCRVCGHSCITAAYRSDDVMYLACESCSAVQAFEIKRAGVSSESTGAAGPPRRGTTLDG